MTVPVGNPEIEYDEASGTYRTAFDPGTDQPSICLLEAVASISEADPTELAPLDEYVDPDALNVIFDPMQNTAGTHGSLSFHYEGFMIVVHSDGGIELREEI